MHQSGHPSIPLQSPVFTRPQLPFDHSLQSSYDEEFAGFCADFADDLPRNALELSKVLYNLLVNPSYDPVRSGSECPRTRTQLRYFGRSSTIRTQKHFQHTITGYETSLAMLARLLLKASDSFTCVMPVIVTDLRVSDQRLTLKPWALYVLLNDGIQ